MKNSKYTKYNTEDDLGYNKPSLPKSDNWLDNHHTAMKALLDISRELVHISNAFMTTGNAIVSDQLYEISEIVNQARELASSANSDQLNESVKRSQEATGNLLSMALHMCGVPVEDTDIKLPFTEKTPLEEEEDAVIEI